jgi:hypothetical protein
VSEKRLQEIKNSIDLQLSFARAIQLGTNTINILDEELELYDEVIRLNNILNELDKLIEQYSKNDYYYKYNGKYLKSEIIEDLKELKENK